MQRLEKLNQNVTYRHVVDGRRRSGSGNGNGGSGSVAIEVVIRLKVFLEVIGGVVVKEICGGDG